MMFSEIVSEVCCSFSPYYFELALIDAVADPIESHINGLGAALFDCVIGDAFCHLVVGWLVLLLGCC